MNHYAFLITLLTMSPFETSERTTVLMEPKPIDLSAWEVRQPSLPHTGQASWGVDDGALLHQKEIEIDRKQAGVEDDYPAGAMILAGKPEWTDYTFRCRVERRLTRHPGLGFIVRYRDEKNYIIAWADDRHGIDLWRFADGKGKRLAQSGLVRIPYDRTSYIDVQAIADKIAFFINGRKVVEASDATLPAGRVGFCSVENNSGQITHVQVLSGAVAPDLPPLEVLRTPYVLYAGKDKACILWETNMPAPSRIEYAAEGETFRVAEGKSEGLLHKMTLTGLSENTRYIFRCHSDKLAVGEGAFTTDVGPNRPYVVGLIGDNRTFPNQFKRLNDYMMRHRPNLVINVGDICERGRFAHLWDREYFKPNADVARFAPCYVSIGNHEDNSPWFHYGLPYPGTDPKRGHYFSFNYGCVAYLAIDNYRSMIPGSPQYDWVVKTMESDAFRQARWRIVFCHEPAYSVGWQSWTEAGHPEVRNFILPLMEKHKVDIFLNGHTHAYERGVLNGIHHIMIGGGGCGGEDFGRNWPHVQVFKLILQYAVLRVTPQQLVVEVYDYSDKLVDKITIAPNRPKVLPGKVTLGPLPKEVPAGKDLSVVVSYPQGKEQPVRYRAVIKSRTFRDGFWEPTRQAFKASAPTTLQMPMPQVGPIRIMAQALGDELTPTEWTDSPVINVLPPKVPQTDDEFGLKYAATFDIEYLPPWKVEQDTAKGDGAWDVWKGAMVQTGKAREEKDGGKLLLGTHVHAGSSAWSDYVLRAKARSDTKGTASVLFRYRDPNNYYRVTCSQDGRFFRLDKRVNGEFTEIAQKPLLHWDWRTRDAGDTWHAFVVRLDGQRIVVEIDGKKMFDATDPTFDRGRIGFSTSGCPDFRVDEVSVECTRLKK